MTLKSLVPGSLVLVLSAVLWAGSISAAAADKPSWPDAMLAARSSLQSVHQQAEPANPQGMKPFDSGVLSGEGPGRAISVGVSGCRVMRLMTRLENGTGNCNIWGDAKLIAKDGTVTSLSALKPIYARTGWGQLLLDKNWQDHTLQIGSRKFERGLWVHTNSDVCFALDGKYERFEAWAGIDADRATGAARFQVAFEEPAAAGNIWQQMVADYPVEAKWFAEDIGQSPDSYLESHQAVKLLQQAIGRIQPKLKGLDAAQAPADERAALQLYLRSRYYRDACEALQKIRPNDLRGLLAAQTDEAFSHAGATEAYVAAIAKITKVSQALGASAAVDPAALRQSITVLEKAIPGCLQDAAGLSAKVTAFEKRWNDAVPVVVQGDGQALQALGAIARDGSVLRRELLLAVKGMAEFLAVPANADLLADWESQYASLQNDLRAAGHFTRMAAETWRADALVLPSDRDPADIVLRSTAALLADQKRLGAAGLDGFDNELASLVATGKAIDPKDADARWVLFAEACRVRRQIAMHNPLLNFDSIVLIKRHRALFDHMCDQYYGMAARCGGGLYVLSGALGPNPQLRDVLQDATVANGRLKGQKLSGGPADAPNRASFDGEGNRNGEDSGGTFLAPELSYDGKQILFAYVENTGDKRHRHHTDPAQGHWAEGRCYHVFRVNVDGTGLTQLTDGTWNDFDPTWLPNGRIAFISERRGGYLRCGRTCPTYTLFDMAADGGDMDCLSFHETNEWQPSVTNDGRILYTRWDYVDRFGCTAHHPWITTLDGRDSRAVHGNFAPRGARTDMELDCRAIPGSPKFVCTAAPHHGQAYGSIVLVDPRVADDDGMGPVKRVTPEIAFPESQGGAQVYGTPWPLSEDYFLCVYDATMQPGAGQQGSSYKQGNYGVYLIDSFGNKELIYRDADIACLSPIPLRATLAPPAAPDLVKRSTNTNPAVRPAQMAKEPEGVVTVINTYESLKPWPAGTKIKELRVLQVFPMSVPSGAPPHETALRTATAGDSVVPVRWVLGTVPVEADGSAHFRAPADKEIFFQAIDEQGLAVQSMRSATYLHDGEQLVCAGCHEPKHRSPSPQSGAPLATLRAPSVLKPDVEGSKPFSYPVLVQPVLDKHCVECHAKNADKTINLGREPITRNWYASYANLVDRYGFHDYGDGLRTTPGRFGAKASKLYEILQKDHYGVKLSSEEMHRITLWLDCSSMFYGVYEREGGQKQLKGEPALPTLE